MTEPVPEITPGTIAYETAAAKTAGINARQMVLTRDERFDTLKERVDALADLTARVGKLETDNAAQAAQIATLTARLNALPPIGGPTTTPPAQSGR